MGKNRENCCGYAFENGVKILIIKILKQRKLTMIKNIIIKVLSKIYFWLEISHEIDIYNGFRKMYDLHTSFYFNGKGILFYGDGIIKIDENCYIGRHSNIQSSKGAVVHIAKNCKIGPFFCVWTATSNVDQNFGGDEEAIAKIGNIIIEEGVWIGANVVISPNVVVGANSIIGANSVVTKDVPANAIVGGIPAKLIRYKNLS